MLEDRVSWVKHVKRDRVRQLESGQTEGAGVLGPLKTFRNISMRYEPDLDSVSPVSSERGEEYTAIRNSEKENQKMSTLDKQLEKA
jgi:hypothetical protein